MGIHYTYGANKGNKLMEKQAKREKKLRKKSKARSQRRSKDTKRNGKNFRCIKTYHFRFFN